MRGVVMTVGVDVLDVRPPPGGDSVRPALVTPSAVALDRVSRDFKGRLALSDVSLAVEPSQIHALLGPNGAGKTTLLRITAGLMTPSAGTVRILGCEHRSDGRSVRLNIGLVPSGSRSFYLRISAFENLLFFGRTYGLRRKDAARRALEVLEDVGLADARDVRVQSLSTGMQRRLATARALLPEPSVLLIDEATHDLDPRAASQIRLLVRRIANEHGAAVIWATQRVEEIRAFADDVTLLDHGCVCFSGPVAGFLGHAIADRFVVRLLATEPTRTLADIAVCLEHIADVRPAGADGDQFLLEIRDGFFLGSALDALAAGGFTVVSCSEERPGAEAAFLRLTAGT
jgi:ABC-2 type transport system ATP-binding protein